MKRLGLPFGFARWRVLLPGLPFWFAARGGVDLIVLFGLLAGWAVQIWAQFLWLQCLAGMWLLVVMIHQSMVCLSSVRPQSLPKSAVFATPLRRLLSAGQIDIERVSIYRQLFNQYEERASHLTLAAILLLSAREVGKFM